MTGLKALWGAVCFLLLVSNIWAMSHWSEARGVFDDVCYLRQAHLFQRFGLGGFDTDISRDDDHYLASKLRDIGYPELSATVTPPCHTAMPATGKLVLQYPPGTGLALALFPSGHQVVPLYISASLMVFAFALHAIFSASSSGLLWRAGGFGCLAIWLMINPSKASYSMAPTMAVCAAIGYLTARLFTTERTRGWLWPIVALGFLLGLSVNFRLPNLFLVAGYFLPFLLPLLRSRQVQPLLQGTCFAVAYLVGMAPTLVANAINAGSPLATTYGGPDVAPPDFSLAVLWHYVSDMQFVLLALAIVGCVTILPTRDRGVRLVALIAVSNMIVNLAFFLTHPVFTPYYTVPIAMLTLWSLLFALLARPAEAVENGLVEGAVKA
jgi:hypothetical protein